MNPPTQLVIQAGSAGQYWSDVWHYRNVAFFLAWRDVLVRYKQTAIGLAWALIRPLLTMLVFTFIFERLARMPSGGVPYPLLVLAGMLPWQFFAGALAESSTSVIENAAIVTKVYFPRILIPASAVIVSLVDFAVSFLLLLPFMAWYQVFPGLRMISLPLFALMAFVTALGPGLWLAALNVKYRDFRHVVPFVLQLGLYVSPVGYTSAVVPMEWRWAFALNPLVGVIEGFRWAILGSPLDLFAIGLSAAVTLVVFISGVAYFQKTERAFADVI